MPSVAVSRIRTRRSSISPTTSVSFGRCSKRRMLTTPVVITWPLSMLVTRVIGRKTARRPNTSTTSPRTRGRLALRAHQRDEVADPAHLVAGGVEHLQAGQAADEDPVGGGAHSVQGSGPEPDSPVATTGAIRSTVPVVRHASSALAGSGRLRRTASRAPRRLPTTRRGVDDLDRPAPVDQPSAGVLATAWSTSTVRVGRARRAGCSPSVAGEHDQRPVVPRVPDEPRPAPATVGGPRQPADAGLPRRLRHQGGHQASGACRSALGRGHGPRPSVAQQPAAAHRRPGRRYPPTMSDGRTPADCSCTSACPRAAPRSCRG